MKKIYLFLSFVTIAIFFTACDPDDIVTPADIDGVVAEQES